MCGSEHAGTGDHSLSKSTKKSKVPYYARHIVVPGPGSTVEGQVRYSDRNQADSLTIESQQFQIVQFCESLGWKVISWSIEEDISGGPESIEERPKWQAHIAKIGRSVDCSVSIDLSRWSRDPVAPWQALRKIRDQGGYWCTADGQHSLDKIETDLGAQVGFAIGNITNSNFLRQVSKRTIMGNVTRARQGLHNGPVCFGYARPPMPPPPPGYNLMVYKVKQRLPIIPDEAWNEQAQMTNFQALQKIGAMRADGYSYEQIAHWLNDHGFLTGTTNAGKLSDAKRQRFETAYGPHGNRPFIPEGIKTILQSRLPREFVREDGSSSGHGTVFDPVAKIELEGLHVAAWPADLCLRIDAVNEAHHGHTDLGRKTYSERRRTGHYDGVVYTYSGLLLCATCGAHINGYRAGVYMDMSYQWSQECRSGRSATVRDLMLDVDMQLMFNAALPTEIQDQVRQRAQEMAQGYQHAQQETPQIVTRRATLDAERKRIVSAFIKGDITEAEKDEMVAPLKAELQILGPKPIKMPEISSDEVIASGEQWANLATLWRFMTATQRGEMLGLMFEPRGIMVDMEVKRIAYILPKLPFRPLCQLTMLASDLHPGWFVLPVPDLQERDRLITEIAALRGVRIRQRKDGKVIHGSRAILPEIIERMHALRAEGQSYAAIARACGVDVKTVYRYVLLSEKGKPPVDRRRRGRYKQ